MGNYTNSKINLSKFKNEFSFKRSFDMVAFLGFCLYLWEIGSDAWLSYNFIHGANYTKTVHSINDTAVIDTESIKCTQTVTTQTFFHLTNEVKNATTYTFNCFELDPIWGMFALAFIFYPGFAFILFIQPSLNLDLAPCLFILILKFMEKLLFILFFPLILLGLKFVYIFKTGQDDRNDWKSAIMAMTGIEGFWEASFQFMLQLHIVFKRADQEPSTIQILTLASSLLSIAMAKIDNLFADKPQTTIYTKVSLLPMTLLTSISVQGSLALIFTIIELNLLFVLLVYICCVIFYGICCFTNKKLAKAQIIINRKCVITLILIILTIIVNFYEETTFWNLWAKPIKLSELAIVKRKYFNTVSGVCISSTIISVVLKYIQIDKPAIGVESVDESEKPEDSAEQMKAGNKEDVKGTIVMLTLFMFAFAFANLSPLF